MSEASNSHSSNMLNDSEAVSITGKIMVGSIMVLFFVVVFVFLLHVFAKRFRDRQTNGRRFVFTPTPRDSHITTAARLRRGVGLEPSVIQSLPIQVFQRTEFVDGLECAVCLSELSDGDKARLLPKCNHGFHIDCIDVWFQSHSTCPLCRSPVAPESSNPVSDLPPENIRISITATDDSSTTESRSIPPNILFWGDETQVRNSGSYTEDGPSSSSYSSSSSTLPPAISRQGVEKLVIEIPEQLSEAFSSMSPTAEEFKSPMATRLRSLKRLLSGKKRVIPCGPSSTGDVEHGEPVKGSEGSDS